MPVALSVLGKFGNRSQMFTSRFPSKREKQIPWKQNDTLELVKRSHNWWSHLLCIRTRGFIGFDYIQSCWFNSSSIIKNRFTLEANYSTTYLCSSNHNTSRNFSHVVFSLSSDNVLETHVLPNGSDFNLFKVIEHKLTLHNFPANSKCSVLKEDVNCHSPDSDCAIIQEPKTCGAKVLQSTTVTNTPDIFFVGYVHNPNKKYSPGIDGQNISLANLRLNNSAHTDCLELQFTWNPTTTGVKCTPLKINVRMAGMSIMDYGTMERHYLCWPKTIISGKRLLAPFNVWKIDQSRSIPQFNTNLNTNQFTRATMKF